jgi:hypothetical protein
LTGSGQIFRVAMYHENHLDNSLSHLAAIMAR